MSATDLDERSPALLHGIGDNDNFTNPTHAVFLGRKGEIVMTYPLNVDKSMNCLHLNQCPM